MYVYRIATFANLSGFAVGLAFAWTSPMLPKLNGNVDPIKNPLSPPATLLEQSWIASSLGLGAIFGPPIAGLIADRIGRKKSLLVASSPMILSLFVMAFSKTVFLFYVSRFIMGLTTSCTLTILPMYLIEISEDKNRGILASMMNIFVICGHLFAYVVGPFLTLQNFCLVCIVPSILFILLFTSVNPESPYYLATQNVVPLKMTLLKIRPHKSLQEIEKEVLNIKTVVEELNQNKCNFKDLFTTKILRKGLIISTGLITLQQLAGITAVVYYMQTIFDTAASALTSEVSVIVVGSVQFLSTIVSSSLIDVLGRRVLLLSSTVGSASSLLILGIYFFLKNADFNVSGISWVPLASLIVFFVSYTVGLGPIGWMIAAEIFPTNVKAKASAFTAMVCFIENFLVALFFPSLGYYMGMDYTFCLFAAFCIVGTIIIYFFLPETKGKSLPEIQKLLGDI